MLNKLRHEEEGFTLIELLVVILIVGILAAIALPSFLGQQQKGQDAAAKADVRSAVSHVESCFTDEGAYATCGPAHPSLAPGNTSLTFQANAPDAPGEVQLVTKANGYTVTGYSKSTTTFSIDKTGAAIVRNCSRPGEGSCKNALDANNNRW